MKKLDWYIIWKFLSTFFLAILLINVIVIVFDVSERIDDFLQHKVPFRLIIFVYYFNFLPYFTNLFSALFTFIAVIFFTSKMASHTEIIAILSGGISFRRMLRPYILVSILLGGLSFTLYNYVIPKANKKRLNFEYQWMGKRDARFERDIHIQTDPGVYLYVRNFNAETQKGYKFTIEKFNQENMYYKMMAHSIAWDTTTEKWTIKDYHIRLINGREESLHRGISMDTTLGITPKDFASNVVDVTTMNNKELNKFIAKEKLRGSSNVNFYELEKYKRIAFPFATIVLTLIGVALSSRKVRGGTGMHMGLGLGLSFTYIMFNQFASVFATYGSVPTYIAVWIPNIIFFVVALFLIRLAPK